MTDEKENNGVQRKFLKSVGLETAERLLKLADR